MASSKPAGDGALAVVNSASTAPRTPSTPADDALPLRRPPWKHHQVQDIIWLLLRSAHEDLVDEEPLRKEAGVLHGDYTAFVRGSTANPVAPSELWKAIWSSVNDRNFHELDSALRRHNSILATLVPATFVGNRDVIASPPRSPTSGTCPTRSPRSAGTGIPTPQGGQVSHDEDLVLKPSALPLVDT